MSVLSASDTLVTQKGEILPATHSAAPGRSTSFAGSGPVSLADNPAWAGLLRDTQHLRLKGRYTEAYRISEQALQEAERFGPDDTRIVLTLNEIGLVCYHLGRYAQAEKFYLRGIRLIENRVGHHIALANLFDNLASLEEDSGKRYAAAERLRRRALELGVSELGWDHPDVGMLLANLATVCMYRRRYSEARVHFEHALKLFERSPASHLFCSASALANLGVLSYSEGRHSEAASYLVRAIAIFERTLGPDHPDLVRPLLNLGRVYLRVDRALDGEAPLRRALAIAESAMGREHPVVSEILSTYATVLRKSSRKKEAGVLDRRAAAITALNSDRVAANATVDISELRAGR